MTIEDCISKLIEILEEATEDENSVCYVTDVDEPTLKTAIDTMRKYQRIEERMSVPNKYGTMAEDCQILEYVRRVIEDGKVN